MAVRKSLAMNPAWGSAFGDQRFDRGDLPAQSGAVSTAQGGMTHLAADLEGLAVVVQMAVIDVDNLLHRRNYTDKVEHRALADLGGRT